MYNESHLKLRNAPCFNLRLSLSCVAPTHFQKCSTYANLETPVHARNPLSNMNFPQFSTRSSVPSYWDNIDANAPTATCQFPASLDSFPFPLSPQCAMKSVEVSETYSTRTDILHEEPKSEYYAVSSQAANLYHEYVPLLTPRRYQVPQHTDPIAAPLPLLYSARSKEVLASLIAPVQPSRSSQFALGFFADSKQTYPSFFVQRPLKSDVCSVPVFSSPALIRYYSSEPAPRSR